MTDSDEEPDAKALFSELARGQAELASAVVDLKDRMRVEAEARLPAPPPAQAPARQATRREESPEGARTPG
eukprot:936447-Pyramimonas_sp.AAC.1